MPTPAQYLLNLTLQDRITGSLIGSALGDTIGLYTEFLSAAKAAEVYPSRHFTLLGPDGRPTPFHLDFHRAPKELGHWTDDTDHALLILLAFLHGADTRTSASTSPASSSTPCPASPQPTTPSSFPSSRFGGGQPPLPTQLDLAERLRVWTRQGFPPLQTMPLGLGRLVGRVVSSTSFTTDPEGRAREAWERTGRNAAPNGSLMRTHTLGLISVLRGGGLEGGVGFGGAGGVGGDGNVDVDENEDEKDDGKVEEKENTGTRGATGVVEITPAEREVFTCAARLSRVTHVDPRCVLACVIGMALVRGVVRGEVRSETDIDSVITRCLAWFRAEGKVESDGDVDEAELWRHVKPEDEDGLEALRLDEPAAIGYVYKTLGAGVVALRMAMRKEAVEGRGFLVRTRVFEELITDLVMRGGDADTNACFAGALLGGYLGYGTLPDHWKHGLKHEGWLLSKAEALCQMCMGDENR
ncbi:hypothetical protein VTJ49DRAFT_5913 [Mycothermus thermophilus]|uniref:ADP-ribosylglycohydrolase n=1 Tax=Humicola insolens TaxID=85995 RepID=A0ABR3V2S7_HUMIN